MRSMKPGAGEGGWGWAGVREAGTWWAQVWGAPTQGVATLQLLPGPQDPLHRPKGPLGPQGKSGWLLTVWASLAKSCPANLTTSPTRRMGQKGALSGWKRQVFTSAAVRSGRRFPLGSGGGLTRGFPSSVSPLDARPPHLHLMPSRWPAPPPSYMRMGGLILGSSAVLCTWTLTQERLNWGTNGEGLPEGKRDTPPTCGLEVGRRQPRLLQRHPPRFQAQSPLSLPPSPTAQQSPRVGPQPQRMRMLEKLVPESTLGRPPPGERGRRGAPSWGWGCGGGCDASWLREGARTQSFGPLMRSADSLEKTLILGKIEGRRRG